MSDNETRYYAPKGGLPPQTQLTTDRATFTEAYAVLPRGTMTDIVTSALPFWDGMRMWVIARPLSGFAETFSQYIVEVAPGGGSDKPEIDQLAEAVLFVVAGNLVLTLAGLSFLGLGAPSPAPELGAMAARGLPYLLDQWWVPVVPGVAVAVFALVANLAGDAVRDLLGDG